MVINYYTRVVWTAHSIVQREKTPSKEKENEKNTINHYFKRLCHAICYLLKNLKLVSISTKFQKINNVPVLLCTTTLFRH